MTTRRCNGFWFGRAIVGIGETNPHALAVRAGLKPQRQRRVGAMNRAPTNVRVFP